MKTNEAIMTVEQEGILQRYAAAGTRKGMSMKAGSRFVVEAVSGHPGAKFWHSRKVVTV